MKLLTCLLFGGLTIFGVASGELPPAAERPRVVVSTDIGGTDPDDFQSMVHYLIYADRFDTEGLIGSPPGEGRAAHILEVIAAYEQDYENLCTWSADYPTPEALRAVVRQGAIDAQPGETPQMPISDGAALLVERGRLAGPRPLYVLVWGSITDVAQAVHAAPDIKRNIRVYSIGSWNTAMDKKARAYLFDNHPDLWWVESDSTFRGMYMGGEQDGDFGNRRFPAEHVSGHGALGGLFMAKKADIKMGDSPSVLYVLRGNRGNPEEEHWGGAYVRPAPTERPTYWHDNPDPALAVKDKAGAVTVNRWRKEFLRDWQVRMDRALSRKPPEE